MDALIEKIHAAVIAEVPEFFGVLPRVLVQKGGPIVLTYEKEMITEDQLILKTALRVTADSEGNILTLAGTK